MEPTSTHVGMIIALITFFIVFLLVLCYQIKKHKDEQIKNYNAIIKTCIKSIDIFSKESAKLHEITECLVKEMQQFKNSKIYKDYINDK